MHVLLSLENDGSYITRGISLLTSCIEQGIILNNPTLHVPSSTSFLALDNAILISLTNCFNDFSTAVLPYYIPIILAATATSLTLLTLSHTSIVWFRQFNPHVQNLGRAVDHYSDGCSQGRGGVFTLLRDLYQYDAVVSHA